jgi:hypothetical protein
VALAGALLGSAGLLREATLPEAHAWRALQRARGLRPALVATSWDARELRRANAPAARCRGLAELASRWVAAAACAGGPAEQTLGLIAEQAQRRWPRVWPGVRASPWIGRGRAQVIVINVLLPFAAAAGEAQARAVFERIGGEPPNRVLRYMRGLLGQASGVRFRGACQQQGLLHLFKTTCAERRCEACPARDAERVDIELWA